MMKYAEVDAETIEDLIGCCATCYYNHKGSRCRSKICHQCTEEFHGPYCFLCSNCCPQEKCHFCGNIDEIYHSGNFLICSTCRNLALVTGKVKVRVTGIDSEGEEVISLFNS
jgi:hypothetical protein